MKHIKHIIIKWWLLAVVIGLPFLGHAQVVVTNPSGLANDIYQFIEQNYQHGEEMVQLGKQLDAALQNLNTAKENIALVRKTFSVASAYFKDAKILVDTYDNLQLLYNDMERVKSEVQYYQNNGKLSPSKIYYTMRLVGEVSGRAVDTWTFARDQVMSEDNNLSLHERMLQLDKINQEFRRYHNLFKKSMTDLDTEAKEKDISIGAGVTYTILTQRVPNGKPTPEEQDDIDQSVEKASVAVAKDAGADNINAKPVKVKKGAFQSSVISAVAYAITALAILFFGWNFGVYNHGDRQRSDVLWKVGAGYIVMMIALSVLDTVLTFNL